MISAFYRLVRCDCPPGYEGPHCEYLGSPSQSSSQETHKIRNLSIGGKIGFSIAILMCAKVLGSFYCAYRRRVIRAKLGKNAPPPPEYDERAVDDVDDDQEDNNDFTTVDLSPAKDIEDIYDDGTFREVQLL